MPRFLLSTMPALGSAALGHVLAGALVERGHEVVWHTGKEHESLAAEAGARFSPFDRTLSYAGLPPAPDPGERGFAAVSTMMRRLLVDRAPGQVADYETILSWFDADVLITDGHCLGARLTHERGGPRWAVLNETALIGISPEDPPHGLGGLPPATLAGRLRNRARTFATRRIALRSLQAAYRDCRAGMGLPPGRSTVFDALVSPYLHMQPTCPVFEYSRRRLPPQLHFTGPLQPGVPSDFMPPPWWDELRHSRPVVHVTQGTNGSDPEELVWPAVRALAERAGLVVVTMPGLEPDVRLPENVRVAPYLPYQAVLPHADVMVTSGGYSGAQLALANGVPMVVAGSRGDHPEVGARIAWAGAGIWLDGSRPAPDRLAAAVDEVLSDPRYRENAVRLQAHFQAADGPATAAALLERLARGGAPVR
ncbi:nucleotide disphospho-sugar-binding domain-containing protein [Amycolatopsis rubida]|uniref:UDP:flavonoid glycosyltransferase YjiC, YdhE family n=1 Tax=Amycolatopsis rubida TaxID=112413 RepID=A0A1I5TKD4_9PSEU|nr:nucleotide disphospho-sugar-binding domain-containing protein [Amycolatopsis rubida]SFP83532.1 UDP:flavonoid glycosyltransferase YjiC, YdhE family [Amycolatopsis rubida]